MLTTAQSFGAFPENSTHVSSDSNQIHANESEQDGSSNDKEAPYYVSIEPKTKRDNHIETISLSETQTFTLIDFKAVCVSNEDSDIETIKQKNHIYNEVINSKFDFIFKKLSFS